MSDVCRSLHIPAARQGSHPRVWTHSFSPLPLSRSILHILIYVTAEWFEPQVKQRICLVVCDSPFNEKENAYVSLIKASPPSLCPTHTTNLTLLLHLYTQEGAQNNTPPFIFHSLKAAQRLVGGCKAVVVTTVTLSELLQGEAEITKSSTQLEATTSRFESSKVPDGAGWSLGMAGQIVGVAKDSTEQQWHQNLRACDIHTVTIHRVMVMMFIDLTTSVVLFWISPSFGHPELETESGFSETFICHPTSLHSSLSLYASPRHIKALWKYDENEIGSHSPRK